MSTLNTGTAGSFETLVPNVRNTWHRRWKAVTLIPTAGRTKLRTVKRRKSKNCSLLAQCGSTCALIPYHCIPSWRANRSTCSRPISSTDGGNKVVWTNVSVPNIKKEKCIHQVSCNCLLSCETQHQIHVTRISRCMKLITWRQFLRFIVCAALYTA